MRASDQRLTPLVAANPAAYEARIVLGCALYALGERARIDLEYERLEDAKQRLLQHSLRIAPNDPDALALLGAANALADDTAGFAAVEARALAVNPKFAQFYSAIADDLTRVHRYRDAIRLNEQAFQGDPYDLQTFNMLTSFYDVADKEFEWVAAGSMRVRLHREEKAVLSRYVPALLEEAHAALSARYGMKPELPLHVELFPDKDMFSIRSTGMSSVSAHGICFGHVITARSPATGDFNWAEVLWHEMSHVVHIQLSDSRVPRWFTEGLAVYESSLGRPEWRREMDRELLAYLDAGKLHGIDDLNLSFSQAKSFDDILVAYYHAYKVAEHISTTFGAKKTREMLVAWGKRRKTTEVFKEVLELTTAQYDAVFSAELEKQLAPLRKNLPLLKELAKAKEPGGDAAVLDLQKAIGLDPLSTQLHEELYTTLDSMGKKAEAYPLRRKAFALDEHNAKLTRELLGGAAQLGATKEEVLRWGELGNHVAPLQAEQHLAFARELKRLGLPERARFEAESALLLEPNNAEAKALAKP